VLIPASPDPPGAASGAAGQRRGHRPIVVDGAIACGSIGSVRVGKRTHRDPRMLEDIAPTILIISIVPRRRGRDLGRPHRPDDRLADREADRVRRPRVRGASVRAPPAARARSRGAAPVARDRLMRRQLEGRPFVETFAADLSHELKNPVAAIRASAEVLADGALEEPEEAARFVQRIQEATAASRLLLGDLL
jgi:two-component system sensor histidine kinase CreC